LKPSLKFLSRAGTHRLSAPIPDPEEQEKIIKYNDLVANAVIFQNVVDVSRVLHALIAEGYPVKREDVAALSPYLTRHVKRFGAYFIEVSVPPQPLAESELALPL
jgi:Tn3 transposase DDE domain